MHDSKPVKKQEGMIVDTTSYMKIVCGHNTLGKKATPTYLQTWGSNKAVV